jgi:hypothetical protein
MKKTWIWHENTGIYLAEYTQNLLPEWDVHGKVALRQVYESEAPQWYGWIPKLGGPEVFVGKFATREEAQRAVERADQEH